MLWHQIHKYNHRYYKWPHSCIKSRLVWNHSSQCPGAVQQWDVCSQVQLFFGSLTSNFTAKCCRWLISVFLLIQTEREHSAEIIKKAAGIHVFVKAKSFQTTDVFLRLKLLKEHQWISFSPNKWGFVWLPVSRVLYNVGGDCTVTMDTTKLQGTRL